MEAIKIGSVKWSLQRPRPIEKESEAFGGTSYILMGSIDIIIKPMSADLSYFDNKSLQHQEIPILEKIVEYHYVEK